MLNAGYRRHFGFELRNRSLDTMDLTLHLERAGAFPESRKIRSFDLDTLCGLVAIEPHDRHTAGAMRSLPPRSSCTSCGLHAVSSVIRSRSCVSRSYRPATRRPECNQWRSFGRLLPLEHSCRMRCVRAPAVYNSPKASEDHYVELQTEQMNDGTLKVNLLGRLDIIGTNAIDLRFTSLTATRKASVIVDLSGVDFLSSMGVRLLLSNAKALASRGGMMVICKPDPMVRKVLETTGTDAIIPLYDDLDSAHQALKPS